MIGHNSRLVPILSYTIQLELRSATGLFLIPNPLYFLVITCLFLTITFSIP